MLYLTGTMLEKEDDIYFVDSHPTNEKFNMGLVIRTNEYHFQFLNAFLKERFSSSFTAEILFEFIGKTFSVRVYFENLYFVRETILLFVLLHNGKFSYKICTFNVDTLALKTSDSYDFAAILLQQFFFADKRLNFSCNLNFGLFSPSFELDSTDSIRSLNLMHNVIQKLLQQCMILAFPILMLYIVCP